MIFQDEEDTNTSTINKVSVWNRVVVWDDTYLKSKFILKKCITMRAIYNNQVIAESDHTLVVEGNH